MTEQDDGQAPDTPIDGRILDFARGELGPASEKHVRTPAVLAAVRARMAAGQDLTDAVLGELHDCLATDRRVANEFAAHFLDDLMRTGSISMTYSSRLRRFLDTGDLVLSVFGDMWGDLSTLRFESRSSFRALFAQRVQWKAADKARRLRSERRREDRRVPERPEDLELPAREAPGGPLRHTMQREDRDRLILILLRLKERERQLLTLHLKGEPVDVIARELQFPSTEAARKALARAVEQARHLAGSGPPERGAPPASGTGPEMS